MQINNFCLGVSSPTPPVAPGWCQATPTLLGLGNSWPWTFQSGVFEQGASGGDSALLEATRLSGIAWTSLRSPHLAPAASAHVARPQEAVVTWQWGAPKGYCPVLSCSLPRGGGGGGGGAQGNKTGQEAQAGGGHSRPGTNSQHRKPQPTPPPPTRPKLWEKGVPKAWYPSRGKGQGLARGKGGARSSPVLALVLDPTWGGGEEARLAGKVLPL